MNKVVKSAFLVTFTFYNVCMADSVPPHLAAMAKQIYQEKIVPLGPSDSSTPELQYLSRGIALIQSSSIRYWPEGEVRIEGSATRFAEALGLDLEVPQHWALLHQVLSTPGRERRLSLLEEFRGVDMYSLDLNTGMQRLDLALSEALSSLKIRHIIELEEPGSSLELAWNPHRGHFSMILKAGASEQEGFTLSLSGSVSLVTEANNDDVSLSMTPGDEPPLISTDSQIEDYWTGLIGDWVETPLSAHPGAVWHFEALGNSEAQRDGPSIQERLDALRQEIRRISESRVYRWTNPETGKHSDQQRFRRMDEPWEYVGEVNTYPDSEIRITELEARVAALEEENQVRPLEQYDPINIEEVMESTDTSVSLLVHITFPEGYRASYETAYFQAGRVTARRTLKDTRDITNLPGAIVRQLVNSWSPPEWVELNVRPNPETRRLQLDGSRWRLHVTWSNDYGYDVDSIHTPFSKGLELRRNPANRAEGARQGEGI